MKKIFKTLVSVDEAKKLIESFYKPKPLGIEEATLFKSLGRVLAENILSPVDVPSFDRSLRDGYAVRYEDLVTAREDNPIKLKLIDFFEAGTKKKTYVNPGEAVKIATGAPIPGGANSIVMEEYTSFKDGYVYVYKSTMPNEWIQFTGSDIMYGEPVMRKGIILTPRELGVLASMGYKEIKVYRKPKVGIISTGDEIKTPGSHLNYGEIYDVNTYSIFNMLVENGAEPYFLGIARDNPEEIRSLLTEGLDKFDVVITSGSTSVGVRDNLFNVISSLGEPGILFYGIKTSPGKPTMAALIDSKLIIGLPGFPVSCLMIFDSIFADVIRSLGGLPRRERYHIEAKAGFILKGKSGIRYYHPVFLKNIGGQIKFYPIHMTSGAIATLSNSDGYIEIGENINYINVDETMPVYLFGKDIKPANLVIITSHSIAFDMLIKSFKESFPEVNLKIVYSGSTGGVLAIRDGYNDLGGMHLLDEETNLYNVTYLDKLDVENAVLYRGFSREVGFVVEKDNPKSIFSFEDIVDKDIRFINRSQGSGTRVFIDINLKKIADKRKVSFSKIIRGIDGYFVEAKTHTSVVASVEVGKADVGITIRPATIGRNVDFIPIGWEQYDFLVNKDSLLNNKVVSIFISYLSSDEAVTILNNIPGVKIGDDYMKILREV